MSNMSKVLRFGMYQHLRRRPPHGPACSMMQNQRGPVICVMTRDTVRHHASMAVRASWI